MLRHLRLVFVSFLIIKFFSDGATSSRSPVSPPQKLSYQYYDKIRQIPSNDVFPEAQSGSNVIRVTTSTNSTLQTRKSFRLCDLISMTALTERFGYTNPTFHVNSDGAALLAAVHFNERIDSVVSELKHLEDCDIQLSLQFYDTHHSPMEGSTILVDDVLTRSHSLETPLPCALLGATLSYTSASLSVLSSVNDIPMVSHSATSSFLDKKGIYGLFGRTVPSDTGYAVAALTYLRTVLNVTQCGVLYIRDEWGSAFNRDFNQAKIELFPNMTVESVPFGVDSDEKSLRDAVRKLERTGFNYFFGIVLYSHYDLVMRVAYREGLTGPGKFWLFSASGVKFHREGFTYDAATDGDIANATSGTGVLELNMQSHEGFDEAWTTLESDPELKDYFLSKQPDYIGASNFTFDLRPSNWEYLRYDAVMALGIAMCRVEADFFTGRSLYDSFRNVSFRGASGRVRFDERTGSRDSRRFSFRVLNIVGNEPNEKGEISFNTSTVAIQNMTFGDLGEFADKSWVTIAPTTYADGNTAAPPVSPAPNMNLIPTGALAFSLSLAAVVMIMSICWAIWTAVFWKSSVVSHSQPQFLIMLCVGTLVMTSSIIPSGAQEPMSEQGINIACMAAPWLYQVGFVITFSALWCKTSWVNEFFKLRRGFRRNKKDSMKILIPALVLFFCTIVVMIVWTVVKPDTWHRVTKRTDIFGREIESYGHCGPKAGKQFSYMTIILIPLNIVVLAVTIIENYRARKIISKYDEGFYINLSMISILEAFALGTPVLISVFSDPGAFYLTQSILVAFIGAVTQLFLFVPKEQTRRLERREDDKGQKSRANTEQMPWSELRRNNLPSKPMSHGYLGESKIYYSDSEGDYSSGCNFVWTQGLNQLAL